MIFSFLIIFIIRRVSLAQRNSVLPHPFIFSINCNVAPINLGYFKLWILLYQICNIKGSHQNCKDIGIRKFEFLAKFAKFYALEITFDMIGNNFLPVNLLITNFYSIHIPHTQL